MYTFGLYVWDYKDDAKKLELRTGLLLEDEPVPSYQLFCKYESSGCQGIFFVDLCKAYLISPVNLKEILDTYKKDLFVFNAGLEDYKRLTAPILDILVERAISLDSRLYVEIRYNQLYAIRHIESYNTTIVTYDGLYKLQDALDFADRMNLI